MQKIPTSLVDSLPANDRVVEGKRFTGTISSMESRLVYSDCIFEDVTWAHVVLEDIKFVNCKFFGNSFKNSNLKDCLFQDLDVSAALVFTDCTLDDNIFSGVLAEDVVFNHCILHSNTWHQIALKRLTYQDSDCVMNTHTDSQFHGASWVRCRVRDDGFAGIKSGYFGHDLCHIQRLILGSVVVDSVEVKNSTGEMIRYFKSSIEKMDLRAAFVSQLSIAEGECGRLSVVGGKLPLLTLQNAAFQCIHFDNVPMENAMFDGSKIDELQMVVVSIKGGSFRQSHIGAFKANHCSLTQVDAKGLKLGAADCKNMMIENSDFAGQDRRQWNGVDFKKTEFEQKMSFEEKQWWTAFQNGSVNLIS